jgi:hypothetical protein
MCLGNCHKENREYQTSIYSYTEKYVSPGTTAVTNKIGVVRSV